MHRPILPWLKTRADILNHPYIYAAAATCNMAPGMVAALFFSMSAEDVHFAVPPPALATALATFLGIPSESAAALQDMDRCWMQPDIGWLPIRADLHTSPQLRKVARMADVPLGAVLWAALQHLTNLWLSQESQISPLELMEACSLSKDKAETLLRELEASHAVTADGSGWLIPYLAVREMRSRRHADAQARYRKKRKDEWQLHDKSNGSDKCDKSDTKKERNKKERAKDIAPDGAPSFFEEMWKAFALFKGRMNAVKAWEKHVAAHGTPSPEEKKQILFALQQMAEERPHSDNRNPMHLATVISQRRWEDMEATYVPPRPVQPSAPPCPESRCALLCRLLAKDCACLPYTKSRDTYLEALANMQKARILLDDLSPQDADRLRGHMDKLRPILSAKASFMGMIDGPDDAVDPTLIVSNGHRAKLMGA